ncbi:MAG: NAD(P)/FAD-dependent oxidoreductase [Vicinamibacterales bacterium]
MGDAVDVIVIGAGPAGLSTARALAAQGRSVLVLEEHEQVGQPVHCTGLLGLEAFDELDLPTHTIRTVLRSARFHGAGGRTVAVDAHGVAAAVVDRAAFDRALAKQAVDAGADLRCAHRVQQIEIETDRVMVHACAPADRTTAFQARVCVLACGAQYRFNRQLGLGIPRAYLQTAQVEAPFAPLDTVEIDLDRAIAPGGFAWVVPFSIDRVAGARIGLMAVNNAAVRFARYAETLSERFGLPEHAALGAPRLKVLPLGPVRRSYGDRVLAVGDAAGLTKPTTGGGIYYSLLSGNIAAEVLLDRLRDDRLNRESLRSYETQWRARLGPELRAGLAFRTLAARFDNRAVDALLELAAIDGIVPLLRRTADFNWHRETALALLRHAGFRRIVLNALWS